ncbi:MAG: Gfo/Idh/MocA family oxidoreductase [Armatimonadia bacterium]
MSEKIRIGLIGVGSWANRVQIPQVLSHPQAQLVALSARTEEKLHKAGADFGVTALYTDYQALLARDDLDAVCISSTHNMHYEMAKAALDRGLHVFCEKPLGMNSTQTRELRDLAAQKGVVTMVSFTNRWVPESAESKHLLDEGYVGEPFHYNICQLAGYAKPGGNWLWRADPVLGGGVLYDLGCHNIDLALWLNGPITEVCATWKNTVPARPRGDEILPTVCNDTIAFLAQFRNGCEGIFHISWTAPGDRLMRHELAGRGGMLSLSLYHDIWRNALTGCRVGEPALQPLPISDDAQGAIPRAVATPEERDVAHKAFLFDYPSLVRAFIDRIRTAPTLRGGAPDFAAGHETQKVMDAVLLSHDEHRWVSISEFGD